MKKRVSFGMNIGASSILIIIIILTLVCFAGLSLASSNADYRLCQKLADRTSSYYEATSQAYIELYEACKKESSSNEDSLEKTFSISDNQALYLSAALHPNKEHRYMITDFKIINESKEELDNKLSLLLK